MDCFHENEHALTGNIQAEMSTYLVEEKIRLVIFEDPFQF